MRGFRIVSENQTHIGCVGQGADEGRESNDVREGDAHRALSPPEVLVSVDDQVCEVSVRNLNGSGAGGV